MPYLEDYQIERAARSLRIRVGIDDKFIPDMMTVIVSCKQLHLIDNYHRVPDADMPNDEAAYDPERKLLLIRESVFELMNQGDPRARFTIAHELGHMWLQHPILRHRNVSGRRIEALATIRRDEAQADRFAAAFLVPTHLVDNPMHLSVEQITRDFRVSKKYARNRKKELEREYRRRNNIKRPLPDNVIELLKEAQRRGYKPKTEI